MARARNIKPGFFRNEDLVELPCETRLLFIGLWTIADREGRLEDRPKRIKMELFPADDLDLDACLNQLQDGGFILRYQMDGGKFIQIANFTKHQNPHYKEVASEIPPPPGHVDSGVVTFGVPDEQRYRILERDEHKCRNCGSTERLQIDHVIPRSKGGDGTDDNLQVLCLRCNTGKNNRQASADVGSTSDQVRTDVGQPSTRSAVLVTDSLIPDSGFSDSLIPPNPEKPAKPERVKPPGPEPDPPRPDEPPPFALLEALCEVLGQDVSVLSPSEKAKQLKIAQRLVAGGMTAADVRDMTKWLKMQTWITGGIDMFSLERSLAKWKLAGKPDATVTPLKRSPNGYQKDIGYTTDELIAMSRGEKP